MRTNRILLGLASCIAMLACSEEKAGDSGRIDLDEEGRAYLKVNISDAGSTRASAGNFEYSETEHDVATADFYFYDAAGVYVAKANVWADGNNNKDHGIEYMGNSVVVLKGLKQKNFPKYMVTVLNAPAKFEPAGTLTEMKEVLAGGYKSGDNFIMTTTSYDKGTTPYCVTEIAEGNFKKEPQTAEDADPVKVYVERLAAKVTLKVDETALKPVAGKENVYELTLTVAGEDNGELDKDPATGATTLYVKFLGWGLNATAKDSYLLKKIDTNWKNLGFNWNDPTYFRSYWGMSYNYDKKDATFPENAASADNSSETQYLTYISAAQLGNAMGASAYCAENTNTSKVVSAHPKTAVTSILLKAQVTTKNDETPTLVVYNGALYTESAYLDYVLNSLKNAGKLNAYTKTGENTYTQIKGTYAQLVDEGNGSVYAELTDAAKVAGTLYKTDASGNWSNLGEADFTAIENDMKAFNATNKAIAYKEGLMYYNIPVEHFNEDEITEVDGEKVIPEAKYGIVRNHHYVVSINSLLRLGKGIYNPDEVIVPDDNEDEELYYVGADVNILAWKIVNQNVGL